MGKPISTNQTHQWNCWTVSLLGRTKILGNNTNHNHGKINNDNTKQYIRIHQKQVSISKNEFTVFGKWLWKTIANELKFHEKETA